jgi:hypothetical protein
MIERIATQVVLAIENARLLEESQRNAVREQTVNELSSQFSHSSTWILCFKMQCARSTGFLRFPKYLFSLSQSKKPEIQNKRSL